MIELGRRKLDELDRQQADRCAERGAEIVSLKKVAAERRKRGRRE
jgi:hypothetical protein